MYMYDHEREQQYTTLVASFKFDCNHSTRVRVQVIHRPCTYRLHLEALRYPAEGINSPKDKC